MANGAKTEFIFIASKKWKDIYDAMDNENCLRAGVVKVEKNGVVVMCTRGAKSRKKSRS